MSFEERIRKASETSKSRIVLALDPEDPDRQKLMQRSIDTLAKASEYICGLKINRQLVLSLGLRNGVDSIVQMAHELSIPTIMDAKLNDVGHTNEFMARSYMDAGFDAIIASPVVGWEGGMDSVFKLAASRGKALIMLTYMSNPGAEIFYSMKSARHGEAPKAVFEIFTELATEWKAHGLIVGATKPEIIRRVRELAGPRMAIYSPGIGPQGGDPKQAIEAGADYLIVGRAIYDAADPAAAAKRIRELTD